MFLLNSEHLKFYKLIISSDSEEKFFKSVRNFSKKLLVNLIEDFYELIQDFEQNSESSEKIQVFPNTLLRRLNLLISQTCNLGCVYCYGAKGSYDKESLMTEKIAAKTLEVFTKLYIGIQDVNFFGGEPLLNLRLIEYVLKWFSTRLGEQPSYVIVTSLAVPPRVVEELTGLISRYKECNIVVTVSIDGPPEIHNLTRPFKNGYSSFNLIDENIKKLRYINQPKAFEVTYTKLHQDLNVKPEDIIDFLVKRYHLTHERIFIVPVVSTDPKIAVQDTCLSSFGIWNRLFKLRKCDPYIKEQIQQIFDRITNSKPNTYFCDAGISNFTVTASGEIYPCQMLVGKDGFKIGTVYENIGTLKEKMRHKHFEYARIFSKHYKECEDCFMEYLCSQCTAGNYISTGQWISFDECVQKRNFVTQVLRSYLDRI
ncbi:MULTISPECIES: radical SAM/SPASM domain-containing protein [unclassified Thermosipho (in: thermotogales)]|uniref:radical SAM/SPASM domain-containing protein n=1 Tax=unclassified Thermosipho (in: thermotogales) TaxID=2676525 RepID=UPI0009493377|nr:MULTISPECIES: SPASM domain-containing protein [unclassified Thermosipho (in: thermotogales)]ANQ54583.1 hypothetical protein Y592_03420 [Thermosipho sp. 1070]OOC44765.1 hypothetical protein XO08_03370 [Thermosipho sp. 1074]